ncbi:hypothetical protein AAFC00_007123 [Neodothiora populina]|uniref:beta-glucosidase n=1 Tax=Neodothiora populina TaxID=2781224 RepID=A0ABR3PDH6_9PEZI
MHTQFFRAVTQTLTGETTVAEAAGLVYGLMRDDERIAMLQGAWSLSHYLSQGQLTTGQMVPYPASTSPRLGIPGFHIVDGPSGSVVGCSTEFPSPLSRAASFDCNQERLIGEAIGAEVRALGGNLYSGICLHVTRNPARRGTPESYGEDPLVAMSMGTAIAKGVRTHVMAGIRHSISDSTITQQQSKDAASENPAADEQLLRHLCSFRDVVGDSGAEAILCSNSSANDTVHGKSTSMLKAAFRERWKMHDIVMISNFSETSPNPVTSVRAGLDVELPRGKGRTTSVELALEYGTLDWSNIQSIVERVIAAQIQFCRRTLKASVPDIGVVRCKRHIDLARRAVANSMVLLKNERDFLPLSDSTGKKVALLGVIADRTNDHAEESAHVHTPSGISPLAAISNDARSTIQHNSGHKIAQAVQLARQADTVIIFLGSCRGGHDSAVFSRYHVGFSLSSLSFKQPFQSRSHKIESPKMRRSKTRNAGVLDTSDLDLARAVLEVAGSKSVVVVQADSSVVVPAWLRQKCMAVLFAGNSGRQFGNGLRDVLFGVREPAGRLPFVLMDSERQLQEWIARDDKAIDDGMCGYRVFQKYNLTPAYPFGYGLGYGDISLGPLWCKTHVTDSTFNVTVRAENSGSTQSAAVVQIYGCRETRRKDSVASTRPAMFLLGFSKEVLLPGQTSEIPVLCRVESLAEFDSVTQSLTARAGSYELYACRYEGDMSGAHQGTTIPRDIHY